MLPRRESAIVLAMVLVFVAVYLSFDLNRLYALRYGADLGTYLQMGINLQHGSSWNGAEWRPHFLVHDSWMLALLVLPLAIFPWAQTLLAIQVLAVACATFPLVRFARDAGNASSAACLLGAAYLLSPATQGLAYDNFSENVFVPVAAFLGAIAVRRRTILPALVAAQCLLGLKEDEAFFIAWFGIACALWWDRRMGLWLTALAFGNALAFAIVERVAGGYPSLPAYGLPIHDPSGKVSMTLLLLAPFAFTPLALGRRLLLGAPLLAEIVFAKPWAFEVSRIGSHWVAPLLAATSLAAALGLPQWPKAARALVPCALIAGILFNDSVLKPGRWPYVIDWQRYQRAAALRDSAREVVVPREDEGVWAVAAANPRIRLSRRLLANDIRCPAYDTNARAFFASLRFGAAAAMPLCQGVPVPRGSATPLPFP
jgi:uncharacterized membrane protein